MITYSNTTTARLEAFARARKLDVGILISPQNSAGRYFLVRNKTKLLPRWVSLGWTVAEAKEALGRYADDLPLIPSATGYSFSV